MNKSKTKVMMENDTPIYVKKTRRFKEESRPDIKHSPSTVTSSMITLEYA